MSMTAFLMLPVELHEIIIGHLDFPATAHLKHTCQYFKDLVQQIDIYEAENSEYGMAHGLWACKECCCLRPASHFSDKNKKGKRAKKRSQATKRFCIPCGVKERPSGGALYSRGDRIYVDGNLHVICNTCSPFNLSQDVTHRSMCEACNDRYSRSAERILNPLVREPRMTRALFSDIDLLRLDMIHSLDTLEETLRKAKDEIEAAMEHAKLKRRLCQKISELTNKRLNQI